MNASYFVRRSLRALFLFVVAACGVAQIETAKQEYQPQVGQEGKDVIWVPTPQPVVEKMLDMAKVTAKDYVIDLGSGDGRTVITAANPTFSTRARILNFFEDANCQVLVNTTSASFKVAVV